MCFTPQPPKPTPVVLPPPTGLRNPLAELVRNPMALLLTKVMVITRLISTGLGVTFAAQPLPSTMQSAVACINLSVNHSTQCPIRDSWADAMFLLNGSIDGKGVATTFSAAQAVAEVSALTGLQLSVVGVTGAAFLEREADALLRDKADANGKGKAYTVWNGSADDNWESSAGAFCPLNGSLSNDAMGAILPADATRLGK